MSIKSQENAEQVSALLDGQLRGEAFRQALEHLADSDEARDTWDTYHLVGEIMRSGQVDLSPHDPAFVQRLRLKMSSGASDLVASDDLSIRAKSQNKHKSQSANDRWWRRVAGLLPAVLVGVLAWQGYQYLGRDGSVGATPQLAQLPASPAVLTSVASAPVMADNSAVPVMIRDPQLDALLAAHRQFAGTSALQTPSGFLRNATFEESGR